MLSDKLKNIFSTKERVIENVPLRKLPTQISPIVDTSEFYSPMQNLIFNSPYRNLSSYPVVGRVSVAQEKSWPLSMWHSTRIVE